MRRRVISAIVNETLAERDAQFFAKQAHEITPVRSIRVSRLLFPGIGF